MKKMKIIYCVLFAVIINLPAFALLMSNWKLKEGYSVKFVGGRIKGSFEKLSANISFDKEHPEQSKISATVEANSIATGFFLKNSHAKDALGADEHPAIRFVSSSVEKSGNGYVARGSLTLRGVTKPAAIRFTFEGSNNSGTFKGELKVIPREFNIDRSGTPDEVTVYLTVPVTR